MPFFSSLLEYLLMVKIIQKLDGCIGCGTCVVLCPKYWEMNEDGNKAVLKGSTQNTSGDWELEVNDSECNKDAEEACPVSVISQSDQA
ncbi:ferredoxin [Patescibacteria group bacterium]